jgi:hypothetical protein
MRHEERRVFGRSGVPVAVRLAKLRFAENAAHSARTAYTVEVEVASAAT